MGAIFEEIKKSKKYRYCIFHIKDEKVISVEEKGDRDASYDAFLSDLQKGGDGECRYGLYDFEYEHQCQGTTESSKKQKLFLMNWCPDSAKIKKKMLYASSFDNLKKSLVGVHKFIQVFRQQMHRRRLKAKWRNSCALLTESKTHARANLHRWRFWDPQSPRYGG